ncbi:MAG: lipopolysaccharide biosynthesis protein [Bacteroidales bacterium]|nr:lipopolysaccharide biosynthesis protein [Candidatus Colimorpha merdihippi]
MAQKSLKRLLSDTMIYGMSSIIGRFLNYLLVPLYTYKIAAASGGYGIVTEVYAYTALLLVMLTFGMETTFFYFANKYRERSDSVFSTSLSAVGIVSGIFVLLLCCFIRPISHALGYDAHPEFLTMMGVVVAIDAFQSILFALLRFQGRAWKFALLKLLFIFCNIGLNLFVFLLAPAWAESMPALMGWYRPDYQVGYIFAVNLICTAGITLGFLPELRKLRFGIDKKLLREMLRYTWPLLLFGIAGILNQVADKICFNHLVPGEEGRIQLGIYGACVKIAMIMAMITQAFRYAYEPFVFGGGKEKDGKESQALVMKYFVMFALLAFLAVMAYLDILKHIISPSYWEGLKVVPIVMMAEIFMSIYFNLSFWYKMIEQTWWGAIFSAIGCAVLIAINIVFVPRYGYMACAWGGFCGYGVCMVLSYLVGHKKSPVPYRLLPILGYFALALGLYAISVWCKPSSTIWSLAFNTLLILIYVAAMLYNERKALAPVLSRFKK